MIDLSILICIGEGREKFLPWLAWNIAKQTGIDFSRVEIVFDMPESLIQPMKSVFQPLLPKGIACTYMTSEPDTLVPVKRERLLKAARGTYSTWFDSDDWQAPNRLRHDLAALRVHEAVYVVHSGLRYMELGSGRWCELPLYRDKGIPITVTGKTELLSKIPFDPWRVRASDAYWFLELEAYHGENRVLVRRPAPYFFALYHGSNMTPHISRFNYTQPEGELAKLCGSDWGDTGEQLDGLRESLYGEEAL